MGSRWRVCLVDRVTPMQLSLGSGSLPTIFLLGSNGPHFQSLGETGDRHISVEDCADRMPSREARWQDSYETDDRSGKIGILF